MHQLTLTELKQLFRARTIERTSEIWARVCSKRKLDPDTIEHHPGSREFHASRLG